jgi:hypothetical protein
MSANAIVCSVPAATTQLFTNTGSTISVGNSGFGTTLNSSQLLMPTGSIALSAAPAFSAYLSSNITLPTSTYTLAKFDTIEYQTGSGYSTTTGLFTVPSGWGGLYQITANLNLQGTSIANSFCVIYKNGVYYKKGVQIGATSACGALASLVIKLAAADTISIYGYCASGTSCTIYTGGASFDSWMSMAYLRS